MAKLLKNRDFWLAAAIVILGFYTGFFRGLFEAPERKQAFSPSRIAYLEIDYGQKLRAFEGELMNDMSVLDGLLAASRGGRFEVRYAIIGGETDIFKINGLVEDGMNQKNWNFYLNGQRVETGLIHEIAIKSGDKISVKFE